MHRTEGENFDESSGKKLHSTEAPYTVVTPELLNSIQEEIMNVIEQAGLPVLFKDSDTRDQLWKAMRQIILPVDYVVSTQLEFEAMITRSAANTYVINGEYKSVYLKVLDGGYDFTQVLAEGDTWGDLYTTNVVSFEFENGAFISFGDNQGNLTVNTEGAAIINGDIRGIGTTSAGITESYQLAADNVEFRNCKCSKRFSSTAMAGFRGSATTSHNQTSKYIGCSVFDLTTEHASRVIQGFADTLNKSACIHYDWDGTSNIEQLNDPFVKYTGMRQVGNDTNIPTNYMDIDALDDENIVIANVTGSILAKYQWSGNLFTIVGSGLAVTNLGNAGVCWINDTDVALAGGNADFLRTYRFNGSTWSQVGNSATTGAVAPCSITKLTSTTIAHIDTTDELLRVYSWDGTDWTLEGSGFSIPGIDAPIISALNETDIALVDTTLDLLETYRWNGSTWSKIGNSYSLPAANNLAYVTALNQTDVVVQDFGTAKIQPYRFDGQDWAPISVGFPTGGVQAWMTALNGIDVAFIDESNDDLRVYRLDYELVNS